MLNKLNVFATFSAHGWCLSFGHVWHYFKVEQTVHLQKENAALRKAMHQPHSKQTP
jgi:hypothetical protein